MRILDTDSDRTLKNAILYLRVEEAKELCDSISSLIEKNSYNEHEHINDRLYEHEITVVLYDNEKLDTVSERSKKVIVFDR